MVFFGYPVGPGPVTVKYSVATKYGQLIWFDWLLTSFRDGDIPTSMEIDCGPIAKMMHDFAVTVRIMTRAIMTRYWQSTVRNITLSSWTCRSSSTRDAWSSVKIRSILTQRCLRDSVRHSVFIKMTWLFTRFYRCVPSSREEPIRNQVVHYQIVLHFPHR